jgi:cytochrome c biogenesis protein CcmG/thiol:disulfide interchange protein DsbE
LFHFSDRRPLVYSFESTKAIINYTFRRMAYKSSVLQRLFLTATLLLLGCSRGSYPGMVGHEAPDFTVQDSDRRVELYQLRGRVIVLNFWATWCPPCVEEMPSLVAMQQQLRPGVQVLAVSVDEDPAAYHHFLQEHAINLLTVRDAGKKSSTLYGTFGWPETYIIDRRGVIRRKFIGPVDWSSPEIVHYLNSL